MPGEVMSEQQVAAYVHMDIREVVKLASRGRIPCRKVAGRFQFRKGDVDHWVELQMHEFGKDRLAGIERGVIAHHGIEEDSMLLCSLIPPEGVAVPLQARTRDAVLRALTDLAGKTDLVHAGRRLLAEVAKREQLCTTALIPGVAAPHPRHPLPHDIAASFVVVGLTAGGIPYGSADGSLTRLFFLICCKDDRTHLHVLARLGQVLHDRAAVEELLVTQTADELRDLLVRRERAIGQRAGQP